MKKLILLILISAIPTIILISSNYYNHISEIYSVKFDPRSKYPKDVHWEYIKERLFDKNGDNKGISPKKFTGPIFFDLKGAQHQDSIVLASVIQELKLLIPNKVIGFLGAGNELDDYYEKNKLELGRYYRPMSSTINLVFYEKRKSIVNHGSQLIFSYLKDGNVISRNRRINSFFPSFNYTRISFYLNKETSFDRRKQYVRYEILRSLCHIKENTGIYSSYEAKGIYNRKEFNPDDYRFTEADKFLLHKLYANDFLEQFKGYLYTAYSWRFANVFLNKSFAKKQALIIVFFIGLLAFVLLFSFFQNRKFEYLFLSYFFPSLLVWSYYIYLQSIYKHLTTIPYYGINKVMQIDAVFDVFIFALITSLLLWVLEKRCIKKNMNFSFTLLLKVCFTFLAFSAPVITIFFIKGGREAVDEFFFPIVFFWVFLALGRGVLIYLNHVSDSLVKEKDVELSRLKTLNAKSELKLLQSHINPHFLYNALNSIAGLAHNNPNKTEKMALSLSNLFRYSINKKGQKMSTVEEEVLMVQNYLEIEKIRFGERLKFTTHIDEALTEEEIPMYILQPLVENAIKHGISKIRGEGHITLEIKKILELFLIIVSDNGPDFPNGLVSGHGLQTVYDLLRLSYGNRASLKWENTPKKHITISIKPTA
ncbi:sensor histidine kinase [Flavivirga algicola]|uniref:Histidine kinase n=1 Tax=Flavivirga algicola TaxID=2729136 RepID=A0ABX1RZJ3_9FLAO|nr:histidine kinase [Flavivirga algicola]NMH88997.1 histidine kinase [Flavivirga algicola]